MRRYTLWLATVGAVGATLASGSAFSQTGAIAPPTEFATTSGPAADGTPAWYLRGSFPDPVGRTATEAGGRVTILGPTSGGAAVAAMPGMVPHCSKSIICTNPLGPTRGTMKRVTYAQTMGYTYEFPYTLPPGTGGIPAVALDSKGNLWVFQRTQPGSPKLFQFSNDGKLLKSLPESVTGPAVKAHGMAIDADDNIWVLDTSLASAKKISPEGKLLQVIGTPGRRGDWDETRNLRLLWEPVMIAFGKNGDIYIAEGHGHESPNDVGSLDWANNLGNSRIIHLDKDGNFKDQYFGNNNGPGKFYSAHGFAIDPKTGDLWIGDREDYRIVVLTADGKFVKTIQTTGLVCAIQFDAQGEPWYASGQDGQYLKINRDGKVLGAVGKGMGIEPGEFIEASYWVFDRHNSLYAGDTSVNRITKMLAPHR